jgi:microcystin-dependent protein
MKIKKLFIVALLFLSLSSFAQVDAYIGEVRLFAGNFPPRGWAFCDGTILSVQSNAALFSILGTTYGGNGINTFGLPDLRGRVAVHAGYSTGPTLEHIDLGEKGGKETNIVIGTLPRLSITGASFDTKTTGRDGAPWAVQTVTLDATDQPQVLDNRPPYLGLNYIICVEGIFPMRN